MDLLHYGLQRSGTNFLAALLEKKYRVRIRNRAVQDRSSPMHKHVRLYEDKDLIPEPLYKNDIRVHSIRDLERRLDVVPAYYLVISKDPYSWFLSYARWAKRCNWPQAAHHYIQEYNLFYGKWLELSRETDRIMFVRYADLLRDARAALARLQARTGMRPKWLARLLPNAIAKVDQSGEFSREQRDAYLAERYLDEFSEPAIRELNALLDAQVAASLGYERRGAPSRPPRARP